MLLERRFPRTGDESVRRLMGAKRCVADFECVKCGDDNPVVRVIEDRDFVLCRRSPPQRCKFWLRYGDDYLCFCPLRVHLAKQPVR